MLGYDASALLGGYNAWASLYPVEPTPKAGEKGAHDH
jgi:hypothetical protein